MMVLCIEMIIMRIHPKVYYGLTDLGKEMMPIIDPLADFGDYYKTIVD